MVPAGLARFTRRARRRVSGLPAPSARWRGRGRGGGDHREAEHSHERLDGVGGRLPPPVALPAVSVHGARRAAPLLDSPIQNHAPSPRGFLARLEILGEIRHGAADDHQVARRGTEAGSGSRCLGGARAPSGGARPRGSPRGMRPTRTFHHGSRMPKEAPSTKPYRPERLRPGAASRPRGTASRLALSGAAGQQAPGSRLAGCWGDAGTMRAGGLASAFPGERRPRDGRDALHSPQGTLHSGQCRGAKAPSNNTSQLAPPGNGPHLHPRQCKCRSGGPCLTPRSGDPWLDRMPWHSCCSVDRGPV